MSNSSKAGTYEILYAPFDVAIGYIIWAKLDKETAWSLLEHDRPLRYLYEWNCGEITCILDIVISTGWSSYAIKALLDLRHQHRPIMYKKPQQNRTMLRNSSLRTTNTRKE